MPEVRAAAGQVVDLARSAGDRLRGRQPFAVGLLACWLAAVLLDAATTLRMNGNGFEEANPVLAPLMTGSGLAILPVVLAASLLALALGVLSCGRPRGLYAWVVVGMLVLVLAAKVAVGTSNWVLLLTGVDAF